MVIMPFEGFQNGYRKGLSTNLKNRTSNVKQQDWQEVQDLVMLKETHITSSMSRGTHREEIYFL